MTEKPVERLNYFNGQRLQAADFKLEQDYHMRVRRWLNRSLYTPGIASGLQVYKIEGAPRVKVLPGLAIDHLGREIILLEEKNVPVAGHGNGNGNGACTGPYLTIRYQEDVVAQQDACCAVGGDAGSKAAWSGPARILAEPVLELNADLPHESSGKIALACLTLAKGCESVERVDAGVRRDIGPASAAKVRQYALEGVRDIDGKNSARIYFHIRGRQPNAVTLYLRAEQFPTIYYTEMGWHEHTKSLTGNNETGPAWDVDNHTHPSDPLKPMTTEFEVPEIKSGTTEEERSPISGQHTDKHMVWGQISARPDPENLTFWDIFKDPARAIAEALGLLNKKEPYPPNPTAPGYALRVITRSEDRFEDLKLAVNMSVLYGKHQHTIVGNTGNPEDTPALKDRHKHDLTTSLVIDKAGVDQLDNDYKARSGETEKALTYIDNLQIEIDGKNVTEGARTQVVNNRPDTENWAKFGELNASSHPFVEKGTGPIRIDYLPGVRLSEGEHDIVLSVSGVGNGGRIHFNLYVE